MKKEWLKNRTVLIGFAAALVILFAATEFFFGISPSSIKVLDARVTFKFTAYQNSDQYFVSYSLENTKKIPAEAVVRVQLGETSLGGYLFRSLSSQSSVAKLEPNETKAFVVQFDISKKKSGAGREMDARAKVKRVRRL